MESATKKRAIMSQGAIFFSSSKPPRSPHSSTRTITRLPNYLIPSTSRVGSSSVVDSNVFFKKAAETVLRPLRIMDDSKIEEERRLKKKISNRMSARRNKARKDQELLDMKKKAFCLKMHIDALVPEVMQTKHKRDELEKENEVLRKMLEEKLAISESAERDTKELQAEIKLLKEIKERNKKPGDMEIKKELTMREIMIMNYREWI